MSRARIMIARCLAATGKAGEAIDILDQVLEAHPRDEIGDQARTLKSELK